MISTCTQAHVIYMKMVITLKLRDFDKLTYFPMVYEILSDKISLLRLLAMFDDNF